MKKISLLSLFVLVSLVSSAQTNNYFSLGVGVNQSTFLIDPGFFVEGEMDRMWMPDFYPSPELVFQYNVDFKKRHTLAAALNIVYYQRIIALALPINIRYDYRFLDRKNTPFVRIDGGYSFFLTSGAYYGLGLGYKLGRTRTSFAYNNQFKRNSILEDNEFISARIASMSLKFEYSFGKRP